MLCCAVFFCWAGVQPRETISGLFGRKARNTSKFWIYGERFIDWMHTGREERHCYDTWQCEVRMRGALYGSD
jgi:hypothetical protein